MRAVSPGTYDDLSEINEMRSLFSRCHETYSSPVTHCHTDARTSRPPLSVAFAMILYEPACGGV